MKWPKVFDPVAPTLGTWTDGEREIRAMYFEPGHVRVEREGESPDVLSDEEWLDRLDRLKDQGWYKLR